MKPTHWRAVCVASLSVAWAVPVSADQSCKPVVGHFEAFVVPPGQGHCPAVAPFCTAGRVWGGASRATIGDYIGTLCPL